MSNLLCTGAIYMNWTKNFVPLQNDSINVKSPRIIDFSFVNNVTFMFSFASVKEPYNAVVTPSKNQWTIHRATKTHCFEVKSTVTDPVFDWHYWLVVPQ